TVSDHGPGFDPQALPRTTRTMGLATMRERATAVRGRLTVESAPGAGTTVTAAIPERVTARGQRSRQDPGAAGRRPRGRPPGPQGRPPAPARHRGGGRGGKRARRARGGGEPPAGRDPHGPRDAGW